MSEVAVPAQHKYPTCIGSTTAEVTVIRGRTMSWIPLQGTLCHGLCRQANPAGSHHQRAVCCYSQIKKLVPHFPLLLPPPGFDLVLKKLPLFSEYLPILHPHTFPKAQKSLEQRWYSKHFISQLPSPHAVPYRKMSHLKHWWILSHSPSLKWEKFDPREAQKTHFSTQPLTTPRNKPPPHTDKIQRSTNSFFISYQQILFIKEALKTGSLPAGPQQNVPCTLGLCIACSSQDLPLWCISWAACCTPGHSELETRVQCTGPSSEVARTYWFETSQKIFGSIFSTVARKKMHGTVLRTVFQKSFKSNYAPSTPAAKLSLLTGTGFFFLCVCSFLFGLTFLFQKLSLSHLFSGNVHRHCNTTKMGARTKPMMHSP